MSSSASPPSSPVSLASNTFVRFLAASGVAACVNFGSRFAFSVWVPYAVAVVLAYTCGMVTAFVLNRLFVFTEPSRKTSHSLLIFAGVNVLSLLQTLLVSVLLADWLLPAIGIHEMAEAVGHAAGIVAPVFTSYLAHKHWSFGTAEAAAIAEEPVVD
ncbi:MAG: GtrA family protein [Nocardioides sp.]|uniref:GtrA family protein n=1 Tax=Nocardioides sp. TaxID=35761 RepID=UPI0039E2B3FE